MKFIIDKTKPIKAELERLYNGFKSPGREFSSLERDEFLIKLYNDGTHIHNIITKFNEEFKLNCIRQQITGRICNLRRYGFPIARRYLLEDKKRVKMVKDAKHDVKHVVMPWLLTEEDRAKLKRLHESPKAHYNWSTVELDEFFIANFNSDIGSGEIAKRANSKFNLKLNSLQVRGRLAALRKHGFPVKYKREVKHKVREVHEIKHKRIVKHEDNNHKRQHHLELERLIHVGAVLRFNGNTQELMSRYTHEAVKEAVKRDLEGLNL